VCIVFPGSTHPARSSPAFRWSADLIGGEHIQCIRTSASATPCKISECQPVR
jgi:hypothetical protein